MTAASRIRPSTRSISTKIGENQSASDLGLVFFMQSRDIIFVVRLSDGQILEANPAAERAYGFSREELLERNIHDLVAIKTPPLAGSRLAQANISGILFETLHRRKGGEIFSVEVSSAGIEFRGEPALLSIIRDISERKAAHQLLEKIFTSMPGVVIVQDPTTRVITHCSAAVQRVLGYFPEEMIGQTTQRIYENAAMYEAFGRRMRASIDQEGIYHTEQWLRRKDGGRICAEMTATEIRDETTSQRIAFVGSIFDITERKLAEQDLVESEERYRRLVDLSPDCIAVHSEGKVAYINQAGIRLLGAQSEDEIVGKSIIDFVPVADRRAILERIGQMANGLPVPPLEEKIVRPDGSTIDGEITAAPIQFQAKPAILLVGRDITKRKLAARELERRMVELEALHAVALAGTEAASTQELLDRVAGIIREKLYPDHFGVAFLDEQTQQLSFHPSFGWSSPMDTVSTPKERGISGAVIRTGCARRVADTRLDPEYLEINPQTRSELCVPITIGSRTIGVINLESSQLDSFSEADERLVKAIASELGTALEKVRFLEAEQSRRRELEALEQISAVLRSEEHQDRILQAVLKRVTAVMDLEGAAIVLSDSQTGAWITRTGQGRLNEIVTLQLPLEGAICQRVAATQHYYLDNHFSPDSCPQWPDPELKIKAFLCLALIVDGQTQGVFYLGRNHDFLPADIHLAMAVADALASALHVVDLHDQTRQQIERLQALRTIDQSILSHLDLQGTLAVLLEKITDQLQVDAANFLLYQPRSQQLITGAERGLPADPIWDVGVELAKTHAGRVATTRQKEIIPDLSQIDDRLTEKIHQLGETFISYAAVPLIAKGELQGVLQLFHRQKLVPAPDWLGFLEALADQAAIAIHSAQLYEEQLQTHARLTKAYEDTIDGWSRALDLRDEETEGHSQRVTELTLELARRIGVADDQLLHIRRGARLHDIGKMGIPDRILLKPGKLDPDEWEVMRRHPTLAADLLYPIEFLGPALDIPYCHHEKWDGSGYPQGLKGEETPLSARIFAVIDVWDALTHDRPYRPAWPKEQALAYIREQSGKHFDPQVVAEFLTFIGK